MNKNSAMFYDQLVVRTVEKAQRYEWKAKCIELEREVRNLTKEKLPDYSKMRDKAVQHYQKIYEDSKTLIHAFGLTGK